MAPRTVSHISSPSQSIEKREIRFSNLEEQVSKELKWFYVRYPGGGSRYLYVDSHKYGFVWPNITMFCIIHAIFFYSFYLLYVEGLKYYAIKGVGYGMTAGLGVTTGAHRLWTHRSYEAKFPLRFLLIACHTMAGQNDMFTWVRDHRLHHKFSETDADPHNSLRGMFFAHVGWLLTKKHPDVHIKGRTIDMSDVIGDPLVQFQRKYYIPFYLIFRFYIPIRLAMWTTGVDFYTSIIGLFSTYVGSLHCTWFVNSFAHGFGDKPYNAKIQPRNNKFVSTITLGEGFHNFHHTFPWDYTIGEFVWSYNLGQIFIEWMAKLGFAYNLKRATGEQVQNRMLSARRVKDGTLYQNDHPYEIPHEY
ncbi:stearoyl-CoA desaturase 5-like protein [Leptotrombidium deliense]|uniref:Stearoyl-CoA desaturase 5-like protein n=1 Tax=Leptotrombidium deliense TaxID=299467 RepID=A0A443SGJ2_9ACAR|nr:stearoyl-CoA desaturase 5-like protein [Leptotrombidium deliense]